MSWEYDNAPLLNGYKYDFDNEQFEDKFGRPLRPGWGGKIANDNRGVFGSLRAGETTLRQGVFLKSLVSGTRGEKSELLERIREHGNLESARRRGLTRQLRKTEY